MLNEDKIKLMTSIAMFEKNEGRKIFPINRYFKSDYVSGRMFRAFFGFTLSYLLFLIIWSLTSIERLLSVAQTDEFFRIGEKLVFVYAVGLILYLVLNFVVYSRRYDYASKGIRVYMAKLRRLDRRYEFQSRTRELSKEGRPHDKSTCV